MCLAGCSKNIDTPEAVKEGVIKDIAKKVDVGAMDVNVDSVSFREKGADAKVSFKPKGAPTSQSITMNYALERQGDEWHINVRFYTEVLGLKLTNRFGNSWATVDAGKGLMIGLHPASPKYPAPGTKGSIMLGLEIDEPIAGMVARLSEKGVRFKGSIVQDDTGNFAHLEDPDGNEIYLWETDPVSEPELATAGSTAG